jgi:hypothetical protein
MIVRFWRAFLVWFHEFHDVAECPWCKRGVFIRHGPVRPFLRHETPACTKWSREEA